jgi:hypothetical protein
LTPTSTDVASAVLAVPGTAVDGQMVQAVHKTEAGVTAFEAADAGPAPTALVAVTRNVYVVPLVSPVIAAVVAGGLPDTVTGVCAVVPTYGVTV